MITFKQFLEEGTLHNGTRYDCGYYPNRGDKSLGLLYNTVIPKMSKVFKVPARDFKTATAFGNPIYRKNFNRQHAYSLEDTVLRIILRRKDLDQEMIAVMAPKLLKAELEKVMPTVTIFKTTQIKAVDDSTVTGKKFPPAIDIHFKAEYPQDWIDADKRMYNIP